MTNATELRPQDYNGHVPDPERERWAAYWAAMQEECQAHIREAFALVAQRYEAGETEGYVAIARFCAEEAHGSVYRAIIDLMTRYSCDLQMSQEIAYGRSHGNPPDIDSLIDTAISVLAVKP